MAKWWFFFAVYFRYDLIRSFPPIWPFHFYARKVEKKETAVNGEISEGEFVSWWSKELWCFFSYNEEGSKSTKIGHRHRHGMYLIVLSTFISLCIFRVSWFARKTCIYFCHICFSKHLMRYLFKSICFTKISNKLQSLRNPISQFCISISRFTSLRFRLFNAVGDIYQFNWAMLIPPTMAYKLWVYC